MSVYKSLHVRIHFHQPEKQNPRPTTTEPNGNIAQTKRRRALAFTGTPPHGGAISEVDDSSGDDLDSGVHGDEFRLLGVLVGDEGGPRSVSGAAQLSRHRVGSREGGGLVFGAGAYVAAAVGGDVHGGSDGADWLRSAVARD